MKPTLILNMALAGAFLTLAAAAQAAEAPIGFFSGTISENWEGFPNYLASGDYLSDPTTIMGGHATIANPWLRVYEPAAGASFDLLDSGYAQVSDGAKGMGGKGVRKGVRLQHCPCRQ